LKSAFRKISRVRSFTGGTTWYLTSDCLLAAKRTMYAVEYRRFYLRDLECIVVWPSRSWRYRVIIPGVVFAVIGACFWLWANSISGEIFTGVGLAWVLLELALGPTAGSRVRATGVSVDLPVVRRTRRAEKVLEAINAAVRASRDVTPQSAVQSPVPISSGQPAVPALSPQPAGVSVPTNSEAASAAPSIADATQTNGI
jgi:hypothetical protein